LAVRDSRKAKMEEVLARDSEKAWDSAAFARKQSE
jgi:hypothetical protein